MIKNRNTYFKRQGGMSGISIGASKRGYVRDEMFVHCTLHCELREVKFRGCVFINCEMPRDMRDTLREHNLVGEMLENATEDTYGYQLVGKFAGEEHFITQEPILPLDWAAKDFETACEKVGLEIN